MHKTWSNPNLSNITSLEPSSPRIIIEELLLGLIRHLVVLLGHVPTPNVHLECLCVIFSFCIPSQVYLSSRSWLVCHSVVPFFPINQPIRIKIVESSLQLSSPTHLMFTPCTGGPTSPVVCWSKAIMAPQADVSVRPYPCRSLIPSTVLGGGWRENSSW